MEDKLSYIGRFLYEHDGGKLILALTGTQLNMHYDGDPLGTGDIRFSPTIFSMQYNAEEWSLTSEYALRKLEYDPTIAYIPSQLQQVTGVSYYLQGTHHVNHEWKTLLRYDVTRMDRSDPDGDDYEALTGRPAHGRFAKDWTLGLEWSPNRNWLVRVEHHWVDGTAWLPIQDNLNKETTRHWRMLAVQVSFGF